MSADEPFLSLSADQSQSGREDYRNTLSRVREETGIFAVPTSSRYAAAYISMAIIILVSIFLYMLHGGSDANEEVVVYGSAAAIGLLVASGVSV
jgi:hypothetical protein